MKVPLPAMRLALIATPLHAELTRHGGGPFTDLVLALRDRGHEITVLSAHDDKETVETELAGLPARLVPAKERDPGCYLADKFYKWLSGERKIATDARRIVHFLEERGPFDAMWALAEAPDGLAAGLAKKALLRHGQVAPPLLITVQAVRWASGARPRPLQPEKIRFRRVAGLKRGFLLADLVAANSALAERWLRQYYGVPLEKIARWNVNLTREYLSLRPSANASPADAPESVVFFGALNPTKGPDLFLEAAAKLAENSGRLCQFVLIGGETEKNPAFARKLAELARHPALRRHLEIAGRLPMAEIVPRLHQAAVVVCPSRSDTFSRAALEALALGTPVITSTQVGAREILEQELCGQVAPLEPNALAQAMEDVLTRRDKLAGFARATAPKLVEKHSPEAAARRIEELLLTIRR